MIVWQIQVRIQITNLNARCYAKKCVDDMRADGGIDVGDFKLAQPRAPDAPRSVYQTTLSVSENTIQSGMGDSD